ncbi:MAG: Ig-like domain-containing protein, partial [Anaerolineae bacterium]|nr:Ig-like domain-containing protein [Anaerolineae bacterium]
MRRFGLWIAIGLLISMSASTILARQTQTPTGAALHVASSSPATGQELGKQSPITLSFNQPVNCDTATAAFSITPSVTGDVTCDEAQSTITFTPSADYAHGTAYTVSVSTALQAKAGGALVEAFTLQLNGQGYLAVTDVLPKDGSTDIATDAAITVIFNRPVVPLMTAEENAKLPSPITIA